MSLSTMEQYWVWLSSVEGIGPKRFYQLLSIFEDARSVRDAVGAGGFPENMKFLGRPVLQALRESRQEAYFYRLFDQIEKHDMRVVTRIGEGSRVVVTGDITQIDLPKERTSGLVHALRVLEDVEGIKEIRLTHKDVVRHELVQRIIRAYEKHQRTDRD